MDAVTFTDAKGCRRSTDSRPPAPVRKCSGLKSEKITCISERQPGSRSALFWLYWIHRKPRPALGSPTEKLSNLLHKYSPKRTRIRRHDWSYGCVSGLGPTNLCLLKTRHESQTTLVAARPNATRPRRIPPIKLKPEKGSKQGGRGLAQGSHKGRLNRAISSRLICVRTEGRADPLPRASVLRCRMYRGPLHGPD